MQENSNNSEFMLIIFFYFLIFLLSKDIVPYFLLIIFKSNLTCKLNIDQNLIKPVIIKFKKIRKFYHIFRLLMNFSYGSLMVVT